MKRLPINAVTGVVALAAAAVPAQSFAQEEESFQLEEIIVTASKRTESLQDVAISITALSTATLEKNGFANFEDYAQALPGLSYTSGGPNKNKLAIRGLSDGMELDYLIQSTVGIYFDELPLTNTIINPDLHIFDIERVELLRGPQGTLYGSGSMGGTLRIISNKPNMDGFSGKVDVDVSTTKYGSESYALNGVLNIPISDKAAIRIVGYNKKDAGFIDNTATGEDNWNDVDTSGARVSLRLEPTERLQVTATGIYQDTDVKGRNRYDTKLEGLSFYGPIPESQKDTVELYNLTIDYELGFADLVSSSSYFRGGNDYFFDWTAVGHGVIDALYLFSGVTPNVPHQLDQHYNIFSQEVRLVSSNDGPFEWTVGGYYSDEELWYDQTVWADDLLDIYTNSGAALGNPTLSLLGVLSAPGGPVYLGDDVIFLGYSSSKVESKSLFGEASYSITDKLSATIGLRWFDTTMNIIVSSQGGQNILTGVASFAAAERLGVPISDPSVLGEVIASGGLTASEPMRDDNGINPKFGLEYRANDDVMIFATMSKGYRNGGVNSQLAAGQGAPAYFESDSLWNYELGVKSSLLDGRATVNVGVYYLDWQDVITVGGLNGFRYRTNAGAASIKGIEVEAAIQATENFSFNIGGTLQDPQLEDPFCRDRLPGEECTTDSAKFAAPAGSQLQGAPKFSMNAAAQYNYPISETLELRLLASYKHVGESFRGYNESPYSLGDYHIVNARVSLLSEDGWAVTVYVKNLTNDLGILDTQHVETFTKTYDRETSLRPQTWGVNLRHNF